MNEHQLFIKAIQRPDPAERSSYLVRMCGGDEALRRRVENLLAAHAGASEILKEPAPTDVLTDPQNPPPIALITGPGQDRDVETNCLSTCEHSIIESRFDEAGLYQFEILAELGRGGMGVVYKARHRLLNRIVALKMISDGKHASHEIRARFLIEAEAVARLRHPNIVQIYDIGADEGRPFVTLELLEGGSLADRLEGTTPPGGAAAEMVATLALAMETAHQAGIVHRDLKPPNVLFDRDGTPKITDFGLAKRLEVEEGRTHTGQIMGTPCYMAPEQAQGLNHAIGPAADIYALGAILYEMLTGRPPFKGSSLMETLHQVIYDDVVPPTRIQRRLSRDLETICLKCLRKEPSKRYDTARELADDLHRYLDSRPIRARRTPAWERAGKWARRNPVVAALSGLIVLVAVVGFVGVTYQWQRARENLRQARQFNDRLHVALRDARVQRKEAESQRNRAEDNFRNALDAADAMLTEVGDTELADIPQMEPVRKKLLVKARDSYRKFLYQKGDDPMVRWGAGRVEARLGNVLEMLGDYAEAERTYRRALDLLSPLVLAMPRNADYRRDLAYSYHCRGILRKKSNRFSEAEFDLGEAVRLRRALVDESPKKVDEHLALVESRFQLGTVLARRSGRRRQQEQAYREAVEAQAVLVDQNRGRAELRATLGRYLNRQGMLLSVERPDDAERSFREALDLEEVLIRESPTLPGPRWQLGRITNNLGALLLRVKDRQTEAEEPLRRARDLLRTLAAEFPKIPQYRSELASVYANRAIAEQARGSHEEAEQDCRRALDLLSSLANEFPEIPDYRQKATVASIQLSILMAETHSLDAERLVQEALQEQEQFVAAFPEVSEYAFVLGRDYYQMGRSLVERGDPRSERYLERALHHHRAVLRADPENPTYRVNLGEDLVVWAIALIARGDHARAADVAEELPRLLPDDLQHNCHAAAFLVQCGESATRDAKLSELQRQELVTSYESRAIQILAQAIARHVIRRAEQFDIPEFSRLRGRPDFQRLLESLRGVPVGARGEWRTWTGCSEEFAPYIQTIAITPRLPINRNEGYSVRSRQWS